MAAISACFAKIASTVPPFCLRFPPIRGRLPITHTCFNIIDLPTFNVQYTPEQAEDYAIHTGKFEVDTNHELNDTARVKKILLDKIVTAIYKNVGFGLAGGGRRHRRKKESQSKSKSKK